MNLTAQQLGAWVARVGAIAMVVLAAIPADSLPAGVRPYFAIAGAIIVAVDRYVTDPSTGTPPTPQGFAAHPPPVPSTSAPQSLP